MPDRATMGNAQRAAALATTLVLIGVVAFRVSETRRTTAAPRVEPAAHFVGSGTCASCHTSETGAWHTSQHRAAMAHATDSTVLGDFNGASVTYGGTRSVFSRAGKKFVVRTD